MCCGSWVAKSDTTERLNGTELKVYSFIYNFHLTVLNFQVYKKHLGTLLKCRFLFIMSGVGLESPDLEQASCGADATSRIKVPPLYV